MLGSTFVPLLLIRLHNTTSTTAIFRLLGNEGTQRARKGGGRLSERNRGFVLEDSGTLAAPFATGCGKYSQGFGTVKKDELFLLQIHHI